MSNTQSCKTCIKTFDTSSGKMLKHIKTHGFLSITDYFYSFNELDMCCVCNNRVKIIKNWRFEKKNTCADSQCILKNSNLKKSIGAKKLVLSGKHNFQKEEVIENHVKRTKEAFRNWTHGALKPENIKKNSERLTLRNLTNNPMKDKKIAEKMSISSTGKILTEEHKNNISIGMLNYLNSLTDEESKNRINYSLNHAPYENDDLLYPKLELSHIFENPEIYINNTSEILNCGNKFIENFKQICTDLVDHPKFKLLVTK